MATLWRSLSWLSNMIVNGWPAGTARQSLSNLWPLATSDSDVPPGAHVAPLFMFMSAYAVAAPGPPPAARIMPTASAVHQLPIGLPPHTPEGAPSRLCQPPL